MTPTPPLSTAVADPDLPEQRETFVAYWKARHQYRADFQFLDRNGNFCTPEDDPIHENYQTWLAVLARSAAPAPNKLAEWPFSEGDEQKPDDKIIIAIGDYELTYGDIRAAKLAAPASDIAAAPEQQQDHDAKELWETALAHAAMYVEHHCLDGEEHANTIMGLARPTFGGYSRAKAAAALTATHGPLNLTNRKTADIAGRGYNIVGYVLRSEDGEEVCISAESAVRWLPQAHYGRLMHEQDGSLFAAQPAPAEVSPPDGAMPEQKIEYLVDARWVETNAAFANEMQEKGYPVRTVWSVEGIAAQPTEGSAQVATDETTIRGPLTNRQRSDALALISNFRHLGRDGDDHVIRAIAVMGYVNGAADMREPAPEVAAPERSDTPAATVQMCESCDDPAMSLPNGEYGICQACIDFHSEAAGATPTAASQALDAAAPAGLKEQIKLIANMQDEDWPPQGGSDAERARHWFDAYSRQSEIAKAILARIDGDKQGAPDAGGAQP